MSRLNTKAPHLKSPLLDSVICILLFLSSWIVLATAAFAVSPPVSYILLTLILMGAVGAISIVRHAREETSRLVRMSQAYLIGASVPFVIFVVPLLLIFLLSLAAG